MATGRSKKDAKFKAACAILQKHFGVMNPANVSNTSVVGDEAPNGDTNAITHVRSDSDAYLSTGPNVRGTKRLQLMQTGCGSAFTFLQPVKDEVLVYAQLIFLQNRNMK